MSVCEFSHVRITALTAVVPKRKINIDDEISFYDNDAKKLARNKKILGLGTRYVIDGSTTAVDLCETAALNLLKENSIDPAQIDALIFVSTSPDYAYPASSCILHGRLGLSEDCAAFDIIGLACSGYVYGLHQAYALIESGAAKKILLLVGDISSHHSDRRNRNVNMLFGDAGTATLLEYSEQVEPSYFYLGTRGKDWDKIIAPATGYRFPVRADIANVEETDAAGNVWHLWEDIMDGMGVFKFTMEVAPESIERLLRLSKKKKEDIDFVAFHQANGQIIKTISQCARLNPEQYSAETFRKYANCSTASVATVLADRLYGKSFANVMLVTFGVGLSWASCLVDLSKTKNSGIRFYEPLRQEQGREEIKNHWIKRFKGENV